jgi:hypothetical protein
MAKHPESNTRCKSKFTAWVGAVWNSIYARMRLEGSGEGAEGREGPAEVRLFGGGLIGFGGERFFVPRHVPVPAELSALLGEVGDALETEPLVESD